jgi:LuxR family transcriptional regulator, maltose regulon positive regulatory protein
LLERPHLYNRLDAAVAEHSLTVLGAPPGSGKTSLLAQWSRRAVLPVKWLSLDEQDNEPLGFWRYLVAAIGSSELPADYFQTSGGMDFNTAWRNLPAQLYDEWANLPPFALVLDDFHVISNPLLLESFNWWLDNLPPNLHILLASRTLPDLGLPRRRMRGQLAELDMASLNFSVPETAELLNTILHLNLSADLVEKLVARTEGWIAGVQLAALALQTSPAAPIKIIEKFGGSHTTVFDYFAEELYERQPPAVQDFLLKTSLPALFDPDLVALLTGLSPIEVSTQLVYLENANLFLLRLDESRTLYRYHSLWAGFLADLLHRRPKLAQELKIRLAHYYAGQEQPDLAISFALSAPDFGLAAGLLEAVAPALLSASRYQAFRQWVEALPPAVLTENAALRQNYAWALALSGQTDVALNILTAADYTSPNAIALKAVVAAHRAAPHDVIAFAEQALPNLPESYFFYNALLLLVGQAYRQNGQNRAAENILQKAVATSRATGNLSFQLIGLCYLAELSAGQGNLYRARAIYGDALQLTERHKNSPLAGMVYYGLGNIYFEWNELATAEEWLTKAYTASQKTPGENNAAVALLCIRLASLYLAKNEIENVRSWTQCALNFGKIGNLPFVVSQFAAWQARFALVLGDLPAAHRHLAAYNLDNPATLLSPLQSYEFLTTLRLWLRQQNTCPALELLQNYAVPDQPALALEIQILRALAHFNLGQTNQALADLQIAFELAERGGFLRVFMNELLFNPDFNRLQKVAAQSESFMQTDLFKKVLAATNVDTPSVILSEREQEVLQLVAVGYSTRQIADRLVISPGTVKTHLNHVYEKLNAHSRTQALARARELNLL